MVKKILLKILLLLVLPNFLAAQQKDSTTSLSRTLILQATMSPGHMFYHGGLWNSYFHATLEWCFDNRVSIRSDGSYFFSTKGDFTPFKINHSLLLGAFYHFPKNKFDFYFGIQPGAACVKQNTYTFNDSIINNPHLKIEPIMTVAIGINYFFWKYINLFAAVKFEHGTYIPPYGNSIPLDELRISAGVGWHLHFKKNKI